MKTLMTILALSLLHVTAHAAFMSNPFTTNDGPTTLNVVTNISLLTTNKLYSIGGLTTNTITIYADPAGAANQAQVNAIAQSEGFTVTYLDSNPYHWIDGNATNHITKFDTNVVTSISLGTGLSGSTSLDAAGYHVTIQATGTNNASITNLNPTVLAAAGGLTTNNYGTYADQAGAANQATNAAYILRTDNPKYLLGLTNPAAFDAAGLANASTNNGNIRFTNNFVVGYLAFGTNIVVNSSSTNSRGEITYTISAAAAAGGASGVFQPAATNLYQWAGLSTNQIVPSTNLVTQLAGGTDIGLSATTNAGQVSVTINYTGDLTPQHGSQNLTNWSTLNTNQFIASTNLVRAIVAGTGVTVTATTNQLGITYTVNSSGVQPTIRAGTFTASSGGSGSVTFSSTMGSSPIVTISPSDWGNNVNGRSFVIITGVSATGFSWSNANDTSGVTKTIYYIATLPQ